MNKFTSWQVESLNQNVLEITYFLTEDENEIGQILPIWFHNASLRFNDVKDYYNSNDEGNINLVDIQRKFVRFSHSYKIDEEEKEFSVILQESNNHLSALQTHLWYLLDTNDKNLINFIEEKGNKFISTLKLK